VGIGGYLLGADNPTLSGALSSGAKGAVTGAVAGAVAGGLGFFLPGATSLLGAVGQGALIGSASGGAGQVAYNAITPCRGLGDGLLQAMFFGGLFGGVAGGVGYGIQRWLAPRVPANPEPVPPGWNERWEQMYGVRGNTPHWFDEAGGEWRWHAPDRWHPVGHWDHNPWTEWNSPWRNIYP
jgi:hypothetical protein